MAARGYFRGHRAFWDGENWRYSDTGEIAGFGYEVRPCKKCGRLFEGSNVGKPDPCLGNLPGVKNACCGHGVAKESYICFTNGLIIRGFVVEQEQKALKEYKMQELISRESRHKLFTRWWVKTRPCKNCTQLEPKNLPPAVEFYVPWYAWPLELLHRLFFGVAMLEK